MRLLIEIPHSRKLLIASDSNTGALLQGIASAQLINEEGYGVNKKYMLDTESRISIEVVPDDFSTPVSDPIKTLQKEKELADSRWIEYYNKANKAEQELASLKADLTKRGIELTPAKAPTI